LKKQPGTLADWDRLQEALASVMSRVYSCRVRIETSADPLVLKAERERLADLDAEELRIRNEIATLSRAIRVELEARDA
jgi:hypothetical protein